MNVETIMFSLLRAEICQQTPAEDIPNTPTAEAAKELYSLSALHDIANIVGYRLKKLGLLEQLASAGDFDKQIKLAIYRNTRIAHVYAQLQSLFEAAQIPFIPLKGAVIRSYYPEPWMRTSADIDILVQEEDLDRAVRCMEEAGYANKGRVQYDVSMFSSTGVHVELHFNLITDYVSKTQGQVLSNVWQDAVLQEGTSYHYRMSDPMFYLFHMAHMAKHFKEGGCGVRAVLDTWLINHRMPHDPEARKQLLAKGGLLVFARKMEQLAEVWFSGKPMEEDLVPAAALILSNGVYGTYKQRIAIHQAKQQKRWQYWLKRVFLPYEMLKYHYPVLQKHKWLLPVFEVVRWVKLIFNGGIRRSVREVKTGNAVSSQEEQAIVDLLRSLEL